MTDPIIRTAQRTWQRLGVPPGDASQMSRELEADLAAARADGRDPAQYVGGDPAGFARAWAASRGLVRAKRRTIIVAAAGLAGLLPGAAMAVLAVTLPSSLVFNNMIGNQSFVTTTAGTGGLDAIAYDYAGPVASLGFIAYLGYFLGAVISAGGCYVAVSAVLRLGADPLRTRTLRLLARLGPLIILGACLAGVSAASLTDFSYGADTVALAAAASAAIAAVGIALIRLLSLRTHAEPEL
jgi:hypothetical protein